MIRPADDIYQVGTVSTILQLLKLPDGTVKVLVEGTSRATVTRFTEVENFFEAEVDPAGRCRGAMPKELEALEPHRGRPVRAVYQA